MRVGDGTQHSISTTGLLLQPFYKDDAGTWQKLTYGTRMIEVAIGVDGNGSSTWNTNGTKIVIPTLTNISTDLSGFTATSGDVGYGTITTTGNFTIGSHSLQLITSHHLPQDKSYVTSTYSSKNIGSTTATNVRLWVGVGDDYIDGDDSPDKQRGNIVDGEFQAISSSSQTSNTVKVSAGSGGVSFLFYSLAQNLGTILNNYGVFLEKVVPMNPSSAATSQSNVDGAYGVFIRLDDIGPNETTSFNVYNAAAEPAELADLTSDMSADASARAEIIANYAQDNTQQEPIVADYNAASITGVNANNLADVNAQVDTQTLTTVETIQPVVDSLNAILNHSADSR